MATIGRPMKYRRLIELLDDEKLYTPALIVRNGVELGVFPSNLCCAKSKRRHLRARHALARFSANHHMKPEGDGMVTVPGQAPTRGWTGKSWKRELY